MCFSAPVSFVAGGGLSVIGGATVKKVRTKKEIPYAIIPLIFAVQQIIEGLVWVSFASPGWLNIVSTYAFVFFAFVFWPIWIPFSVGLLEQHKIRRKILLFFFFIGLLLGLSQLYVIATNPITSHVAYNSIVYSVPNDYWTPMVISYLVVTCGGCLVSSYKWVKIFGIVSLVSLVIAYEFYTVTCFSVWCFFGAILSFLVYLHFREQSKVSQIRSKK